MAAKVATATVTGTNDAKGITVDDSGAMSEQEAAAFLKQQFGDEYGWRSDDDDDDDDKSIVDDIDSLRENKGWATISSGEKKKYFVEEIIRIIEMCGRDPSTSFDWLWSDWKCPSCYQINHACNNECRKCCEVKPVKTDISDKLADEALKEAIAATTPADK